MRQNYYQLKSKTNFNTAVDQTIDMIEKEFQKIHDQNKEQQLVPNESTPLKNEDKMRYEKVFDCWLY